jgi:hypothetical protein
MKRKSILVAAMMGAMTLVNAQTTEVTSEGGNVVTPQAGDIALGFNAAPLFNYAGNMFNGTVGNSLNMGWANGNNAIYGKYFMDENTALRGSLRIGFGSTTDNLLYGGSTGDSLTDVVKNSFNSIVLGAGYEKRRGHNRLQGYYGGEFMIGFGGFSTTNTYAEVLSATNPGSRVLSTKSGSGIMFGLRGFIGAEYFFAPKISIAAEYGWGLTFNTSGKGSTETETWNGTAIVNTTSNADNSSYFGIDTDNLGGAIRLMFHF